VQAKAQPLAQPAAKPAPVAPTVLELILDAVLRDVMSNPDLKDERESYGVPGDKHVGLVSNPEYGVLWPKNYSPRLEGFTFHRVREDEVDEASDEKPKMLGVRIDKLDLQQRQSGLMNTPIKITILNGGGTKDGIIQGGCSVYYIPKQKGDSWVVEFSGALDP
jgi:hypothetical protein